MSAPENELFTGFQAPHELEGIVTPAEAFEYAVATADDITDGVDTLNQMLGDLMSDDADADMTIPADKRTVLGLLLMNIGSHARALSETMAELRATLPEPKE